MDRRLRGGDNTLPVSYVGSSGTSGSDGLPGGVSRFMRPPPVPNRLKRERELYSPRDAKYQQAVQQGINAGMKSGMQSGMQSGYSGDFYDPRVEASSSIMRQDPAIGMLEARISKLENERRRDTEVLAKALGALESRQQQKGEAPIMNNQVIDKMERHISSLQEVISAKNEKISSLETQVLRIGEAMTTLERTNASDIKSRGEHANSTIEEIGRLGQILRAQNQRLDLHKESLKNLEHLVSVTRDKTNAIAAREDSDRQAQYDFMKTINGRVDTLHQQVSKLENISANVERSNSHIKEDCFQLRAKVESYVEQIESSMQSRFERFQQDISAALASDRSADHERHTFEMKEVEALVSNLRDALELERRESSLGLQRLRDEVLHKGSAEDHAIAEVRRELEGRVEALAADLYREETARVDSVRRIHEDLLEQISSVEGTNGSNNHILDLGKKLVDLEEVLRAEVRSRMRHESRAREHVENTVKTLQVDTQGMRSELLEHNQKLANELKRTATELTQKVEESNLELTNRFLEHSQETTLELGEFKERVSSCEAKIAKRAALYQVSMDKLDAQIEDLEARMVDRVDATRGEIEGKLDAASESTEAKIKLLQQADIEQEDRMNAAILSCAGEAARGCQEVRGHADFIHRELDEVHKVRVKHVDGELQALTKCIQEVDVKYGAQGAMDRLTTAIETEEARKSAERHANRQASTINDDMQVKVLELQQLVSDKETKLLQQLEAVESALAARATTSEMCTATLGEKLAKEAEERDLAISRLDAKLGSARAESVETTEQVRLGLVAQIEKVATDAALQQMVATVAERAASEEREKLRSHHADAMEATMKELALIKGEIQDEKLITTKLQGNIESMLNSFEEEKLEQDREWEKAVNDAQGFLDEPVAVSEPEAVVEVDEPNANFVPERVAKLDESAAVSEAQPAAEPYHVSEDLPPDEDEDSFAL